MSAPVLAKPASSLADRAGLLRALGVLSEPPGAAHPRLADLVGLPGPTGEAWTEAFIVLLVPYASIYTSSDGMLGGEAADRVAGFWRALRQPVPADADHVAALLGLYAALAEAESTEPPGPGRTLRRHARAALLHEHLVSWLPAYLHAMADCGPAPYAAWARLLDRVLRAEIADLGVAPRLPAHLRAVPTVDWEAGPDEVLTGLLTPARSGVILTRADLASIAQRYGLGLRLGDRRVVLRGLIEQEPGAALAALAERARVWQTWHRAEEPTIGPAAGHWAQRAGATAELLTAAASDLSRSPDLSRPPDLGPAP